MYRAIRQLKSHGGGGKAADHACCGGGLGFSLVPGADLINRYPPDDGGLDAHIGSTCPFCQCWVSTAIHKAHCVSHHARWHVGSCRTGCDQDASLPWVGLERMTIERFTRAPHRAAVAVPR